MKRFLTLAFIWGLLAMPAATAHANDTAFNQALDAHLSQDYARAVELWRGLATTGDPRGQFYLGNAYFKGKGIARDPKQAYLWFVIAEQNGLGSEEDLRYYRRALSPEAVGVITAKAQTCQNNNYKNCR